VREKPRSFFYCLEVVVFTFDELYRAYKLCRLRKLPSPDQIRFEQKLIENLTRLQAELNLGTYKVSAYRCFIVIHPKPREIFAASFRDRVVHHVIVSRLMPIWEKRFYYGSFACRRGKGTHGAMNYLLKKHREVSEGGRKEVFFLQMDLASFFVTVNRNILFNLFRPDIHDDRFLSVVKSSTLNDPTRNVFIQSGSEYRNLILPDKSLFLRGEGQGIPIGNLTSQFGANVYLNSLDHFISRDLRPRAYLRYMDDFLLLDTDREKLLNCIRPITDWALIERKQRINPEKTVLGSFREKGMDYLGHKFTEKKGELAFYPQSKKRFNVICVAKKVYSDFAPSESFHPLIPKESANRDYVKSFASFRAHLGNLKHSKSYQFRKKTVEKLNDDLFEKSQFLGIKRDKIKV